MDGMLSPADISVLAGANRSNSNGGFGDMGAWWVIIFLIFAFGGWGNRGFGGNGSGGSDGGSNGSVLDAYVLNSDFATLQRLMSDGFNNLNNSVTTVNEGLCNGFYNMNSTLLNGFNGVNVGIMQNQFANQTAINNLATQLADCCCTTQRAIDGVNFNLSQLGCGITNAINTSTRDLIENSNANYRALHDEIIANKLESKNELITAQQNEINKLQLSASQSRQNEYLLSQLKECPAPAYIVPNPNTPYNYFVSGYGYNNGCGCNNF